MKIREILLIIKGRPKMVLLIVMVCVISFLSPNSYWCNLPPKQSINEADYREMAPEEGKIIGIVSDKGYNYPDEKKWGYDCLQVDVKVNVGEDGNYAFYSTLYIKDNKIIGLFGDLKGFRHDCFVNDVNLAKGVNIVSIYFFGGSIRRMRANGPYKLAVTMVRKYLVNNPNTKVATVKSVPLDKKDLYTSYFRYSIFSKEDSN